MGSGPRAFTDDEERDIPNHIRTHYLMKHFPLTMSDMRALILKWQAMHLPNNRRD
jgi:hypothetical protein